MEQRKGTKSAEAFPIRLAGDQELVLEEGVVIRAKRGEYRGRGDCVFTATDVANLTIRGYGATVRMQKEDYTVYYFHDRPNGDRYIAATIWAP